MTSLHLLLQNVPLSKLSPVSTKSDPNPFHFPSAVWLIWDFRSSCKCKLGGKIRYVVIRAEKNVREELTGYIYLLNHSTNSIAKAIITSSAKVCPYGLQCTFNNVQRHFKVSLQYWLLIIILTSIFTSGGEHQERFLLLFFTSFSSSSPLLLYIIHTQKYEAVTAASMQKCFL